MNKRLEDLHEKYIKARREMRRLLWNLDALNAEEINDQYYKEPVLAEHERINQILIEINKRMKELT